MPSDGDNATENPYGAPVSILPERESALDSTEQLEHFFLSSGRLILALSAVAAISLLLVVIAVIITLTFDARVSGYIVLAAMPVFASLSLLVGIAVVPRKKWPVILVVLVWAGLSFVAVASSWMLMGFWGLLRM